MVGFLAWYGIGTLTYLCTQIGLSHQEYQRSKNLKTHRYSPKATIIIPTYNESPQDLYDCVHSCLNQKYRNEIDVILVDDGSKDKAAIKYVEKQLGRHPHLLILDEAKNMGKREAQKRAFDILPGDAEIIITIDSDTTLEKDAVRYLVQKFKNPVVGAVTGNCRAKRRGLLSKLIDVRYWTAFNQERGAQSLFGTVLCCSGVMSAYRAEIIHHVKERYVEQTFLGKKCTYGDDRHLTNLVLDIGYSVKYEERAKAVTGVPSNIVQFIKQQVRWNKSFYRELLWSLKMYVRNRGKYPLYMLYDMGIQTVLPLALLASLMFAVTSSIVSNWLYIFGYVSTVIAIAVFRAGYGMVRTKERAFLLFPLYAFLHVFILLPVRVYAIFTLANNRWGTR